MSSMLKMVAYMDLPALSLEQVQRLLEWHDERKLTLTNKGGVNLKYPWVHSKIRDSDLPQSEKEEVAGTLSGTPWNREFVERFPDIVQHLECLPLSYVGKILLLETTKACPVHVDLSTAWCSDVTMEPWSYRMTLRNANGPGFYVQAIPRAEWGSGPRTDKHSPFPKRYFKGELGRWWTLNQWCCQHGSEWDEGDQKVLISVQGTPSEEHRKVLERSKSLGCIEHPALVNRVELA